MQQNNQKSIFIIAGEASADVYAAKLIRDSLKKDPSLRFYGMGGKLMADAGADISIDYKNLAIVGLTEALAKLFLIRRTFKQIEHILEQDRPKLLILIDYPGFNLRMAKVAHKLGIKVLYYISPQIWAWRYKRINKIRENVDMMAVLFPFEEEMYKNANVPVTFVGHPLIEVAKATMSKEDAKKNFALNRAKVVGLFPGSRLGEISKLLPTMIKSAELLKQRFNDLEFVLPLAPSLSKQDLAPYLNNTSIKLTITESATYDTMQVCDAIMACSGTVTLEIGLMKIPYVLIYKVSTLNYWLAKKFIKIPFIGLCNIIADKKIIEELIQENATPEKIAEEVTKILSNANYRQTMIENLSNVRNSLDVSNKNNIVDLVEQMLV